jgi:hypothetical protein
MLRGRLSHRGVVIGGLNDGSWLVRRDLIMRRIRIPSVTERLVLRFYHSVGVVRMTGDNERLELAQRLNTRRRGCREADQANNARLEHPLRNLQQPMTRVRISCTPVDRQPRARR